MHYELAEHIGIVPELYDAGTKSTATILKEAGFPEARHFLSVQELEHVFRKTPRLTDLWFERSHDQRLAGGWGIEKETGGYRVQKYSGGKGFVIADRYTACAEFAARYVGFIGDVLAKWR